jgi:methylmalonyl-CoA/ethylmalonyl-CoA epimerase
MRILGLHHVAFAHKGGTETLDALGTLLDLEIGHTEEASGFIERMLPLGNGGHVQTLEATGPGIIDKYVEGRGSGLHHIAFEVDNIDAAVQQLHDRGATLIDEKARPGGMGTRIAFVHPRSFGGLLVELVEKPASFGQVAEPS